MSETAVHRVLGTAELLGTIFSFLREFKEGAKRKGHAASLAAVNRAFFHASISVIWGDMHSFEPFCPILTEVPVCHPLSDCVALVDLRMYLEPPNRGAG